MREDVAKTKCGSLELADRVELDRKTKVLRATDNLIAGTPISYMEEEFFGYKDRGETVSLISRIGPFEVSRPVTLMQAAKQSDLVLVKTSDGTLLQALLTEDIIR